MRLVLAIAALAAFLLAMLGPAQPPAAQPALSAPPAPTAVLPAGASTQAPVAAAAPPRRDARSTTQAPPDISQLLAVESSVRSARQRGAGENETYQLRASRLTAAQLESLLAMELAESNWTRRVAELRAHCGGSESCGARLRAEDQPRWRSYADAALRH